MPTNLFITNGASGHLGQRLRELISTSREMRALVGFFYFSGVKVLYEALRANPSIKLRVLVGMEAEEHCGRLQELVLSAGYYSTVPSVKKNTVSPKKFVDILLTF